jgi:hypothetical protein
VGGLPGFVGGHFYGYGAASVDWIAPFAGRLIVSGGIFKPDIPEQAGRSTLITMKINGEVFTTIPHFATDWDGTSGEFNGGDPKPLELGTGGAPALTLGVQAGDRLSIVNDHYIMGNMTESFCGLDITLSLDNAAGAGAGGTLYRANDAFDASTNSSATSGPWSLLDNDDNLMVFENSVFGGPAGWVSPTLGSPPAWQTGAFPGEGFIRRVPLLPRSVVRRWRRTVTLDGAGRWHCGDRRAGFPYRVCRTRHGLRGRAQRCGCYGSRSAERYRSR